LTGCVKFLSNVPKRNTKFIDILLDFFYQYSYHSFAHAINLLQKGNKIMIRSIEVLRYKCLQYIHQEMDHFQILVGPNASGKTTFLDVLVLLQDLLRDGVEKTVQKRGRSIRELVWQMESDTLEIAVELEIPNDLRTRVKDYNFIRYELRLGPTENGTLGLPVENLWLIRIDQESNHKKINPQLDIFPKEPQPPQTIIREPRKRTPPGYRKIMSRSSDGRIHMRSETTDWNFPLSIEQDRPALALIPEEERFPTSRWCRQIFTEGIQFLMLNSHAMRKPCHPNAPLQFQPDGSNLPAVVQHLSQDQLNKWITHLQTVLPEIKSVKVKELPDDRYRYLVVETHQGLSLPLWLLSDGTLRLFALTLLPYLPEKQKTYIIEEPENGIHPRALEAIFQSLSSVYEGQVLCATHSALFLNLAKPEELLCFARTDTGATDIVRGNEHPRLREWRKEVSLGDLLASGILG